MILFLMGLACFLAALRVAAAPEAGGNAGGGRRAGWFGLIALLTLTQLWTGRDELDRWRFTLLGLRYRIADTGGRPVPARVVVSGDEEEADLWIPGAGDAPVVSLGPVGEDALLGVAAFPEEDAGAVVLVEERGAFGSEWRVLGGLPLELGDTLHLQGSGVASRLVVGRARGSIPFFDADIPIPWIHEPELALLGPSGEVVSAVKLPSVQGSLLRRMRGFRPSIFQRTYPLADILEGLEETAIVAGSSPSRPALGSFLYFEDGRLHLADLDEEVEATAAAGEGALTVWSPDRGGSRILLAGLPHRDYPEPDLVLPERYGIRPLRSFGVAVSGGWLDITPGAPEIRALDRDALAELSLPGGRDGEGREVYRVRLVPGRTSLARQAIVFDGVPRSFSVAAQAVFRLPGETSASEVGVLAPSGLARWETGRPMALGTGDRRAVVRVDGQGTSPGFWLAHLGLMALVGLLFLRRPMGGAVFALALGAAGLACMRLILGVSALVAYPYVQEAQQIGLWVLVLLPWTVVVAGEASRGVEPDLVTLGAWRRWIFHGLYALAVVGVAVVLFAGSPAKQVVLGAVPLAVLAFWLGARSGWRPWRGAGARFRNAVEARPRAMSGWALGLMLLLARAFLESLGWREQLMLGGTRIGVSVLYTPVAVAIFAGLLHVHAHRLSARAGEGRTAEGVSDALLDVGGFLLFAFLAVSLWISDFGIALVLLPGALAAVALLGFRWAAAGPAPRVARATAMALALPLALFVLFQAAPPLLTFAWGGDLGASEARMEEWNRNELLLLERGDPAALRMIGQRRSEALAVMRETMRSYTRGNLTGKGFLEGRVSGEIADTAAREHAVSALLASQFGLPGVLGLVLILAAFLAPVTALVREGEGGGAGGGQTSGAGALLAGGVALLALVAYLLPSPFNTLLVGLVLLGAAIVAAGPGRGVEVGWFWGEGRESPGKPGAPPPPRRIVALASLYVLAFAGLYMVLANYGLVYFTGKNVYLLGLDSVGDALETLALLGMAALALGMEGGGDPGGAGGTVGEGAAGPAGAGAGGDGWWHAPQREG